MSSIDRAIYNELEQGARNPEGIWDWSVKKRNDLKALRGNLHNREIYNYFEDWGIVKNRKLADIMRSHGLSVEFMRDLEETSIDTFRGNPNF